ncbi:hypothetical protein HK097_004466 [Rhizophlyctis rosea]|uniref:Uncharacterized protein n=1 Tax=Rhizophlyctis rosea TaxID=64517 RepID=A0AAD5S3A0_9FUNG|nr:hypothetical protein HK097_004466 [Rhizophlyctis rosea]
MTTNEPIPDLTPPFLRTSNPPAFPSTSLSHPQTHPSLSKWQHRRGVGGFRRGLASDIILGDRSAFPSSERYLSTMHKDYLHHHNDYTNHQIEMAEFDYASGSFVNSATKAEEKPAGKPLGVANEKDGKTGTQWAFEGCGVRKNGDLCSITKSSYGVVDPGVFREVNEIQAPPDPATLGPIQKHHTKPFTKLSNAHVGLQTRSDLPIDDGKFHSFSTTTSEAFSSKSIPPSESAREGGKVNLERNRISNVGSGNTTGQYETSAGLSWKEWDQRSYVRCKEGDKGRNRKSHINLSMGTQSPGDGFASTNSVTYVGEPVDPENRIYFPGGTGSLRGRSSIAFGGGNFAGGEGTGESVSRRDYVPLKIEKEGLLRSSVEDRLNSKKGIASAIRPDVGVGDVETASRVAFQDPRELKVTNPRARGRTAGVRSLIGGEIDKLDGKSGGLSIARLGNRVMTRSSLPAGDPLSYNFADFETTTKREYPGFWNAEMVPHPVLGANITRSNFEFGESGGVGDDIPPEERFKSSTHASYTPHTHYPQTPIAHGQKSTTHILDAEGGSIYPMSHNHTTHQINFQPPAEPERRFGHAPPNAGRKLLFPLKTVEGVRQQSYETMMERFHGQREGLWNLDEGAERKVVGARRRARDSSIVFGDPKVGLDGRMHLDGEVEPMPFVSMAVEAI